MKNIIISLLTFIFTFLIAIYNFYRKEYILAWLTIVFVLADLFVLGYYVVKFIRKR